MRNNKNHTPYFRHDNTVGYTAAEIALANTMLDHAVEDLNLDNDLDSDEIARLADRVLCVIGAS